MTLADRLRRLLSARGLSIHEAARRAGMPVTQVWKIVAGEVVNPGIRTVERILEGIGATLPELYAAGAGETGDDHAVDRGEDGGSDAAEAAAMSRARCGRECSRRRHP